MRLYSFFNSSTSYRVRIALALKGMAVDLKTVNIRIGEQYSPAHRELSPVGGVPVLTDDAGATLTQSLAIIDHLDELQPAPRLIPAAGEDRMRVLELSLLISCDIHPVNNLRILKYLTNELKVTHEQKQAWYAHWINEGLGAVETLLRRHHHGHYCFGDTPTAADCCLVPQVANALRMGCDLSAMPTLMAIYETCQALPAFQAAAPERQSDYVSN